MPRLEDDRDLPVCERGLGQNDVVGHLLGILELLGVDLADRLEKRSLEPLPHFRLVLERQFGLGTAAMHLDFVHAREPLRLAGLSDYALAGLSFRAVYGKRVGYAAGLMYLRHWL